MENDGEKMDEIMLPGFRFHPTDEELVGFYLRRKIQQRPLSIELIRQLDIYKYDPWDLPKLATTGEKEWYFYCPRDRKYRNSARPNRVTGAGFWKATGTDRPIYSSEGPSKCIGLKKSLVFYKGRAAKGMKTDWMMHEFRLPSLSDTGPCKRFLDKDNIPANDAWAICRIFKKANSSAQRALSHSWVSQQLSPPEPSPITTSHDLVYGTIFTPNETSLTNKNTIGTTSLIQFGDSSTTTSDAQQQSSMASTTFSPVNQNPNPSPPYKPSIINNIGAFPYEPSTDCTTTTTIDASSLLLNMSSQPVTFGVFDEKVSQEQQYFHNFPATLPDEHHEDVMRSRNVYYHGGEHEEGGNGRLILAPINDPNVGMMRDQAQYLETMQSLGYPFNLPLNNMGQDAWKCNLFWDSSPCPSNDLSTSFSTNKCYT